MHVEEEILNELRGSYQTSFYSIYLNGNYNEDISKMSQKDQGTLLHEYVHYLQNISTPFGMYMSKTRYILMYQVLHNVIIVNNPIHFPVTSAFSEQSVASCKKLKAVLGTKKLDGGQNVDWSKEISVAFDSTVVEGSNIEKAIFNVVLTEGKKIDIEIGAIIVMETMSALYQSLIDPIASHPDVPYNIIIKYCQKHYPRLASDTRKLICLCYASLYSLCPGAQLIKLINNYGNNYSIDGYTAFWQFVNNSVVRKVDGSSITLINFVDEMIDEFKESMANILISELEFLDVIFEPVRLSQKWVPVVSALYDKTPFSLNHFKTIIQNVGLPYIHTSYQQYSFPNIDGKSEASRDLIELIALQTVYSYFTTSKTDDKECGLSYMCKGNKYNEDHCKNHPWTQEFECPFSVVCNAFEIDKKTIIG